MKGRYFHTYGLIWLIEMKKVKLLVIIFACLYFLIPFNTEAQITINEFMASNTGVIVDPDYNESADWLELYNSGASAVNISGYYLTDNFNDPVKWQIPDGTSVEAGGFLIIWADSYDTGLHTSFNISASGEELAIYSPSGDIIDSVSFGAQEPNISMGRKTDGAAEWVYFNEATPGATNNTDNYTGIVKSDPTFSIPGGIYNSPISVELKTIFGGEVHYTLDGTEPNENSPLAGDPINITQNTVVRARIYKAGQLLGPVITNSYFIDTDNKMGNLPVVSISTDPKNFWDPEVGIYVQEFKPDWEIPVNIELFENDGRIGSAFNMRAGIKVNGLYSWQLPQKMLGVYFRKEYGGGNLDYPLIFDKNRKRFKDFALRASGSDWANTLFRDGMIQNSTLEYTSLDNSGFRACVVYVNGQYMGIHNLREKIDEDYIVQNHGLTGGTFDMIEEVDKGQNVETGDIDAYNYLQTLTSNDLSNQANYEAVTNEIDIENFTDFVCTEVYSGNSSIAHNLMSWKPKDSGKWKWILMDFDRGFFGANNQMISFYLNESGWPFRELMQNEAFKKQFGLKLADHLFTTFNPARIDSLIEKHKRPIEDEIPSHIERWKGTSSSYGNPISSVNYWNSEVEKLRVFAGARPAVLLNDLTNYGFTTAVPVSVSTIPEKSGMLTFNGLKIPVDHCTGGYPEGEVIKLVANAKAGHNFVGWRANTREQLIAKESDWKYSDTGADLGTSWKDSGFNDTSWKTGKAELGYGDRDENTTVSYGPDSNNKFITTYFRKNFNVSDKESLKDLTILLKCDDGAVVYVNGVEVVRQNLPDGTVDKNTLALTAIGGSNESTFTNYSVNNSAFVNGPNVIGVEVHQNAVNSSDISFDMELSAAGAVNNNYLSTSKELVINVQSGIDVTAVFESDGKCTIPELITSEFILNKDCSPYVVPENVKITASGKLTIEKGVEIWMSDGISINSDGPINIKGTRLEPVIFKSNPQSSEQKWGNISINNVNDTCHFKNVYIQDASKGLNPAYDIFALAVFQSNIVLDSIFVDHVHYNPVAVYNSSTILKNSRLHTEYSGADMLNVKYGKILVDNCDFPGNDKLDVDAIDFGEMTSGSTIVRNSYFHDFPGFNSDAVDLGDHAKNVIIDGIVAYNLQDKGVSIGQQSSAIISNSVFINCGMGAGMKDSSDVHIDHCTYYGNLYAIANYQKHEGDAGANAIITNSVLSNSYESGYLSDEYSAISISHSSDDTELLPDGNNNLFVNPLFTNPTLYDFSLLPGSPLIGAGTFGNIGANIKLPAISPSLMINDIAYVTESGEEDLEFIGLYNPGNSKIDLDSCQFSKGFTFQFPQGVSIGPKEKIYITSNNASTFWNNRGAVVYQWESGHLSDQGEAIQLVDRYGKVIDQVIYNNNETWPAIIYGQGITLKSDNLDNHFGSNWKPADLGVMVNAKDITSSTQELKFYPNPTSGVINISGLNMEDTLLNIYNLSGVLVKSEVVNSSLSQINLASLDQGIYIIRSGNSSHRLILMK